MTEDLQKEYSKLLRQGKEEKATQVARKMSGRDEKDEEEQQESDVELFAELKGVGDELAKELVDRFDSFDDFAESDVEDLEPVPGIGQKRAESLLEQVD
jgi:ERCC4-type nuclease